MEEERISIDPKLDAAMHVNRRKAEWEESLREWRQGRARLDKRYHNYRTDLSTSVDKAQNTPRANIGVPLAAETVDTANARAYDTFFRTQPYGKVWGRESTDDYKASIVQQVIDYQQQAVNLPIISQRVFRDAFKYGVGVAKLHFKRQTRKVPVPRLILGIPVGMTTEERVVFESPVPEHVPIQDIFFPRQSTDIDTAEGVIHRTWETRKQIIEAKDGLGLPLYDTTWLDTYSSGDSKYADSEKQTERETRGMSDEGASHPDEIEILEYTGRLPMSTAAALVAKYYPDADPSADWIVTVRAGDNRPLRCEPSPYLTSRRMFLFARIIDDPGYLTGISIIELVEKLGLTIDELYNIILDNLNFVINKQYYVNTLAGVEDADMISMPGKVVHGSRPFNEAIGVIQTPDISQSVFLVLSMLLNHYKEYTGITQTVLGAAQSGANTATEMALLERHSATRLGQFERMLEDTYMRPLFELWSVLNQQFLDQEFVIRVFKDGQPTYPKVAPEDIQGVFDFRFDGGSRSESIALTSGQIMQMLQINATQPVPIFDPIYLGKKLADTWGWTDTDRALNPQFAEQFLMYQKLQAMKNIGETAQALTPQQQRSAKSATERNPAQQGNAAQPANTQRNGDFRAVLAAMKESALPKQPSEG